MNREEQTARRIRAIGLLAVCAVLFGSKVGFAAQDETELATKLRELKGVCDQGLLSQRECEDSRKSILEKFTKESSNSDGDEKKVAASCNYADGALQVASFKDSLEFSASANALQIVKEILDEAGLAQNFVVRQGPVANAAAVVSGYDRYVLYNSDFLSQLKGAAGTNWAVYSVMAHEIAHHLQGHTLVPGGSRPPTELQADNYSGFILAKLGASLEEAQVAMLKFGDERGSTTHPRRSDRLAAISEGFKKAKAAQAPVVAPKPQETPEPEPNNQSCVDECSRLGERECADELEERVCRRGPDRCLTWESNVCDDGKECSEDRCRRVATQRDDRRAAYCCDGFGMRRCVQVVNPSGVGEPCFCVGQGNGLGCN